MNESEFIINAQIALRVFLDFGDTVPGYRIVESPEQDMVNLGIKGKRYIILDELTEREIEIVALED